MQRRTDVQEGGSMKLGFFTGIEGDLGALREVLELLSDCDRVYSLGNLLGAPGAGDAGCLALVGGAAGGSGRVQLLAGPGERARARDPLLPPEVRVRLRDLMPAAVDAGVALLGGGAGPASPGRRPEPAPEQPRLVAPVTVAPGETTRLWRAAAGSLARIEPVAGSVALPAAERVRIDVGAASGDDGVLGAVVLDLDARTVERRERLRFRALEPRPFRRLG